MIRIEDVSLDVHCGKIRLSARLSLPVDLPLKPHYRTGEMLGFDEFRLCFDFPLAAEGALELLADPFVAALLPLCFWKRNLKLTVAAPISDNLPGQIRQLQDIIAWQRGGSYSSLISFHRLKRSENGHSCDRKRRPSASFFSAGVDSFYTVLKNHHQEPNEDRISHLIYLDTAAVQAPDANHVFGKELLKRISCVAETLGCQVLRVESNLSDLYSRFGLYSLWNSDLPFEKPQIVVNQVTLGAAIWSSALALQRGFCKVFIPSHYTFYTAIQIPNIVSPFTDPLWSTDLVRIVHDGCEANRFEKIVRQIVSSKIATDNLSVCWSKSEISVRGKKTGSRSEEGVSGVEYNCGRCEKCLRTIMALNLLGIEESPVFPRISLDECEQALLSKEVKFSRAQLSFYQEMRGYLIFNKMNPDNIERLGRFIEARSKLGVHERPVN